MRNPFTLGVAQGNDFWNRKAEIEELTRYARNGQSVVLCSPRRYGKSSLVTEILGRLAKQGMLTAYIDLFPITSEKEVISRFAAGVTRGIGSGVDPRSAVERLQGLFAKFIPSLDLEPEGGVKVSLRFDAQAGTDLLLDDLMQGLYCYVEKKGIQACIALDEFQEIVELGRAKELEGTLRSHMQFHKSVSYYFIGSRRRTLQDMFTDKSRPFFKSAFLFTLEEIAEEDFVPYIVDRFRQTGKTCPEEVARQVYTTARGYPYYVQKLSSLLWDITEEVSEPPLVEQAFAILLKMEAYDFEGIWSGLTLIQKATLKALAKDPSSAIYARDYLQRHDLSQGGVQKAIKTLRDKDLIEVDKERRYRLTDPIMGRWLLSA